LLAGFGGTVVHWESGEHTVEYFVGRGRLESFDAEDLALLLEAQDWQQRWRRLFTIRRVLFNLRKTSSARGRSCISPTEIGFCGYSSD
jgi:hypothetical protein